MAKWVPEDQTISQTYYYKVLATLREQVYKKWPQLWKNKSWILHQNNTPAHNTLYVKRYVAIRDAEVVEHTPYSSDLARFLQNVFTVSQFLKITSYFFHNFSKVVPKFILEVWPHFYLIFQKFAENTSKISSTTNFLHNLFPQKTKYWHYRILCNGLITENPNLFLLIFPVLVDIWSVGCIMAELLTGRTLFPGTDRILLLKLA